RRASIGRVGVINAASVDLYRVGIAGAPECARRESVVQASVLVEVHVKIRLVGSDTLTKKLVCRTADGATLGLGGIREKPKAQGEASDEERDGAEKAADVTQALTFHTISLTYVAHRSK